MGIIVGGTYTPAYSPRACTSLKNDVASYCMLTNDDRVLSKAEDCLRGAVDEINSRNWQWLINTQDITTVAGTSSYALAAAFKAPRAIELLNAGGDTKGVLGWQEPKTFQALNPDRSNAGTPYYYTAWNPEMLGTMFLDVKPGSSWVNMYPTIRLYYYAMVVPCGGSTTALSIPAPVAEFVVWRAKEQMAATFDVAKIGYAKTRADQMWRTLVVDDQRSLVQDWEI